MRLPFSEIQPWIRPAAPVRWLITTAVVIASIVFVIDALTMLDIAISVLYVIVVMLIAMTGDRRLTIFAGMACILLTAVGYVLPHIALYNPEAVARSLVGLTAIITSLILSVRSLSNADRLLEKMKLLELSHDAIVVHGLNGIVSSWSRGAHVLYGLTAAEALGRPIHDLLQTSFARPLGDIHAELLSDGYWEGEYVQRCPNGRMVRVKSRWALLRDRHGRPLSIMATNNDITERVAAEQRLMRSEAFLAEAQYLSHTGSVAVDFPTQAVWCSNEAKRILGNLANDTITLRDLYALIHPADTRRMKQVAISIRRGIAMIDQECRLRAPDGGEKQVRFVAHRVSKRFLENGPIGPGQTRSARVDTQDDCEYVGALMDITAAKLTQEALQKSIEDLSHASRLSTLGEMAASIAHEVRQPIAAVVTNGEAALRWLQRPVPELKEACDTIDRMIRDAERSAAVVQRVRTMAQKRDVQLLQVDINRLVHDSLALIHRELQLNTVRVTLELTPGLPRVKVDRVQTQQVLMNLLFNALQAMAQVPTTSRRLHIVTSVDEFLHVVVAVHDRGTGLAEEMAAHLFTPFLSTKSDGMGMGLVIARSIVESFGGKIGVAARQGGGTTAFFSLPAYLCQAESP